VARPLSDDARRPWTLDDLRPHVVNLTRGEFSDDGIMQTSKADVDAIFDEHLPAFLARAKTAVPLVIWAHGGIVSEKAGLSIAGLQIPWWLDNGAYPLHFVWETGFVETFKQLLGWRSDRDRDGDGGPPVDAARATESRQGRFGSQLWTAVKRSAALASDPDGGAHYVGARLARFCADNPGRITVHAAGHSAGAIFQSHFIPAARSQGAPRFDSLQLLAPALRVDGFRSHLLPLVGSDIDRMTLYTMNIRAEQDDNCLQVYRRSLLYLVSRMFEPEDEAPILGLEQSIRQDGELVAAFGLQPGVRGRAEVVWSPTPADAPPESRSSAISHGGFDNDPDTMNSVARRILRRTEILEFPLARRVAR
jgi:hypothetical protein